MPYSRAQLAEYSKMVGKNWRTLQRWAREGCRLEDSESLKAFLTAKQIKRTNIARSRERRGKTKEETCRADAARSVGSSGCSGNGEAPLGRKGVAGTLERLERQEQPAYARLEAALTKGDPLLIDLTQSFWLKTAEVLRRLDISIELARRERDTQIPLRTAEESVLYCAEWLRIAVARFLSSETIALMAFKDSAEFRAYFWQRFKSAIDMVVKGADSTRSPIPSWAKVVIKTAWNVSEPPSD